MNYLDMSKNNFYLQNLKNEKLDCTVINQSFTMQR